MAEAPLAHHSGTAPGVGAPDTVDIHLTDLSEVDADSLARFPALLDGAERERHDRYRVEGARREFLVGRALLRTTLSALDPSTAPADWRFRLNSYGRPEIDTDRHPSAAGRRLFFNLSHTRGLVALATARTPDIGIDVETLDRRAMTADIAARYFTAEEAAFIAAGRGSGFDERFFALWTLKEAYIKARGMGLALPLDGFRYDLSGDEPVITFVPEKIADNAGRWRFARHLYGPHHRLALAIPASTAAVRFHQVWPLAGAPQPITLETAPPFAAGPGDGAP